MLSLATVLLISVSCQNNDLTKLNSEKENRAYTPIGNDIIGFRVHDDGYIQVRSLKEGGLCHIIRIGQAQSLSSFSSCPTELREWLSDSAKLEKGCGYAIIETHQAQDSNEIERVYMKLRIINYAADAFKGTIKDVEFETESLDNINIRLNTQHVDFTSAGGYEYLYMNFPTNVEISGGASWLKCEDLGGVISLYTSSNTTSESRNCQLTFSNASGETTVFINQDPLEKYLFAGGSGKESDPYLVSTAQHLWNIRKAPDCHYLLTGDIDLSEFLKDNNKGWEGAEFRGVFDGGYNKITGLWSSFSPSGLFSEVTSRHDTDKSGKDGLQYAEIRNLFVEVAPDKTMTGSRAGIIAGIMGHAKIIRCSAKGNVTGPEASGIGISAYQDIRNLNTYIEECRFEGSVKGTNSSALGTNCIVTDSYAISGSKESNIQTVFGAYAVNSYSTITAPAVGWPNLRSFSHGYFVWNDLANTPEAYKKATYAGWDFDNVWTIEEGKTLPELRWYADHK